MVENKYYERKIKYLDLLESGERTGGAGFVKVEVQGMEINLTVTVKGLHPTDTYERDVLLQAGDSEFVVGRISLKEGQGQFKYHTVMDYSQLQGIKITLGGVREICCRLREERRSAATQNSFIQGDAEQENVVSGAANDQTEEGEQYKVKPVREIQIIPWDEIKAVEESLERTEKMMSKPSEGDAWKAAEKDAKHTVAGKITEGRAEKRENTAGNMPTEGRAAKKETTTRNMPAEGRIEKREAAARNMTTEERTEKRGATARNMISGERMEKETSVRKATMGGASKKNPVRLMEDKWQQIWAIYPHICPFQDEREYLSISPADFVLLPDEAYRAANNSFLLHGYYNYDHLILTKIEKRGEVSYYIGVPGNYYEREKQVAIMFGFESFECGTEPAQVGDFGYYMMRTQL